MATVTDSTDLMSLTSELEREAKAIGSPISPQEARKRALELILRRLGRSDGWVINAVNRGRKVSLIEDEINKLSSSPPEPDQSNDFGM